MFYIQNRLKILLCTFLSYFYDNYNMINIFNIANDYFCMLRFEEEIIFNLLLLI